MSRPFYRYKRLWLLVCLGLIIVFLLSLRPVQILLQTAPNKPRAEKAMPELPDMTAEAWEAEKVRILKTLEQSLYGSFPDDLEVTVLARARLGSSDDLPNAVIDILKLEIKNSGNNAKSHIDMMLLMPRDIVARPPLILTQNFCPIHDVVPIDVTPKPLDSGYSCSGSKLSNAVMTYVFGRYIATPPLESILQNGYALAVMYPSQFIADKAERARVDLDSFFSNIDSSNRPGALMAWAALSANIADIMDEEFSSIITLGHSRYGKTALLAAAYSDSIDGAVAHQSGTGGASLFRDKPGETLADILGGYPHWFSRAAQSFADDPKTLPLDQHYLLAALAPKPVLLGNARRDVWSDPEGSFRAGQAASKIYGAFGSKGLTAKQLNEFIPSDPISFWIRPGTHGVTEEDWPAFLDFLNAHFRAK